MKSTALVLALLLGLAAIPGASAATAPALDCDSIFDSCNYDCDLGGDVCDRFYFVLGTAEWYCDAAFVYGCPV